MAHQQLPLNNSLGVGGNNRHLVVDPSTNNRYGEMSIQQETTSIGYPELNIVGHGQQQNLKQLPHSNSFNNFPPPPYPHTERYIATDHCASSASSASTISLLHSPTPQQQQHVSAGSLPPITSFGVRQSPTLSSSLNQLTNIGGGGGGGSQNNDSSQQSNTQPVPMAASTSSHSSAACSPSPSPYQQQQQHNHHHYSSQQFSQISSMVTNTSSLTPMQRIESGQQFANSQQQQSSPTTQFGHSQQNHHNHQFQAQQMPSPAYSAHLANSISNPGSIVSAPPESPSSIRSSSVRSNYSMRMVNSTPDSTFMQNNNSNSEHQYGQDALIHHLQDGQMPSNRHGDGMMNNLPAQQQKTPQTMKNTKKNYTPRTQRMKTPVLPVFQLDGPNPALIIGAGEGPTVRQHLQQQQAAKKQKLQQEMMLKRLIKKDGELAMIGGDANNGDKDNNHKRSHVESAPPSVTAAASMMMDGGQITNSTFGGFQLNEWSSSSGSQHLQRINIGPIHHQLCKAESLSPPKRNAATGTNRSRNGGGGQGPKRTGQLHSAAASSSEALASTIASVASGGGSLEEFEKLSAQGSSSPSSSMLSNSSLTTVHPGPSSGPSSSTTELNFSPTISSAPKRRKTAATIPTQSNQKMSPIVMTTTGTPTRQIDSAMATNDAPTIIEKKKDSTTTSLLLNAQQHQTEQISPTKPPPHQQQQCRIHVQNPPQHGDFPLTGTKIQVVHMQPSPTAASAGGVPSPQTECSPRSFMLGSRQQSPFTAAVNNAVEIMASPDSTIPLARNAALMSPYHAAPPQPPQRQFLAPPTPGTPMSSDMATATPPIQCLPGQSPNDFQHPNTIINRQQQQFCGGGGQMAKYSSSRQQQHLQQSSSSSSQNSPLYQNKQEMLGGPSQSPHQYASMAAPPPPPTPMAAPSPQQQQQMFRFHHQQSPLDGMQMQPSQTPPQHHPAMAYQQAMMQQQSPQNQQHYPQQQQQQMFMGRGAMPPADQQQMGTTPPQHSPMFSPHHPHAPQPPPPQQQYNIQGGRPSGAYMSTPPHHHHSPHLQQLLHQQQNSPLLPSHHSGGTFTTTDPSPGPPLDQMLHNSACQTPLQAGPSHQPPTTIAHHPRAQLSRAQLLSRHSREVECETYAVKLYHLQRTIKALVYKNGALGDELARLNQRIHVVTEERKILAKRLQHHERNRIRRIQTHFRKAAAAAAAAVKEEEETCEEPIAGTSASFLKAEIKTEINSSSGSIYGGDGHNETGGMEEKADIVKKKCEDEGGGGGMETNIAALEVNCQQNLLMNEIASSSSNPSPNIPVAHLPPQMQLKIGTTMEMEQNCNNNKFLPNNLMISPQSDRSENSSGSGGINGGGHHEIGPRMALRSRTTSSNSTRTCRELSISPAEQLMMSKASKGQQHEQRTSIRKSARRREQRMEIIPAMDQKNIVGNNLANWEEGGGQQAEMDEEDGPNESDNERPHSRAKQRSQQFNSMHKQEQSMQSAASKQPLLRPSPSTTMMTTRRQSMAIQQIPSDNQPQMNCIGPHRHLAASSISPGGGEQHQNRRRTTTPNTTAAAATIVGSQRRS